MTSGDLTLKITEAVLVVILYALSNAGYLVSLRDPGAELEGGGAGRGLSWLRSCLISFIAKI